MSIYLENETHLVPLRTAFKKLVTIDEYLANTDTMVLFKEYFLHILENIYNRFGWADEGSHIEKLARNSVLKMACKHGQVQCKEQAGKLLSKWIQNQNFYISPNLRSVVYKYGMEEIGTEEIWEVMFERFESEENADEKIKLGAGLESIRDKKVLEKFIQLAKNETIIRTQDFPTTMAGIGNNPIGTQIVWNFIQDEWDYLACRFSLRPRTLDMIVQSAVSSFSTETELNIVKEFFTAHPEEGSQSRTRLQTIEQIENNIKWLKDHHKNIQSFLEGKQVV